MGPERVYVLGAGSIGMPLAVHLALSGRQVTAVRTSTDDVAEQVVEVTIAGGAGKVFRAPVEMVSLAKLERLAGVIVVTSKSYANQLIAARLQEREMAGPVVVLQNGVGVENPFLGLSGCSIYRCVIYATGQQNGDSAYTFMPIAASPIGVVRGDVRERDGLVSTLNTPEFPFVSLDDIQQEVWKKASINSVFNSICPLLEVDNGIFIRDERTARLAREVVEECAAVMESLGFRASVDEIMGQIFAISKRSDGQLISTLQDLNHGRETEIDYLNLEIARVAAARTPDIKVSTTRALGELIKLKSMLRRRVPEAR